MILEDADYLTRTGILVGMKAEARLVRKFFPQAPIAVSGATLTGARAACDRLLACGVTELLSFGLAAGLDPELSAGAIVIPKNVVVAGRRLMCDPAFSVWLGSSSHGVVHSDILHSDVVVSRAEHKQELRTSSGCGALDMESGVVATAAEKGGIGFSVLRVICDPAERSLPKAAEIALQPEGKINVGAMVREIGRHPGQIAGLIKLGRDASAARVNMERFLKRRFPS